MAKKPSQVPARPPLTLAQINSASYIGSAEHKARRFWGGLPQAWVGPSGQATRPKKQDTTICPLTSEADQIEATNWVQRALTQGQYRYLEADKDFPARIWYREPTTGNLWMGFCMNGILGHYKGWPMEEDEFVAVFG
jgi:hypothetical protein